MRPFQLGTRSFNALNLIIRLNAFLFVYLKLLNILSAYLNDNQCINACIFCMFLVLIISSPSQWHVS